MKKILNIDNCSLELSDQQSGVENRDIVFYENELAQTYKVRLERQFSEC